ncbi:MAG: creatininase family protein [Planctomycetota bacterium]|nr:creatininase family protein [Planctomycetota bacterium]
MNDEVRYHLLRPAQVVARRKECPVVYIPVGTLEWHGEHNPLGADTLQAEGLAALAARKGGGLVFPPLYFGENRSEGLMESCAADREDIARLMDLPPENFAPDRMPFGVTDQTLNFNRLLLHILAEADSLGFRVGVLVAGHYPLLDHAQAAVLQFNRRRRTAHDGGMLAWACGDWALLRRNGYPQAGDHAAGWETSNLLALCPETVDLSALPPKGERAVGVAGTIPPQDATAALGRERLATAADLMVREVRHRLEHPELYHPQGAALLEGLWRAEPK